MQKCDDRRNVRSLIAAPLVVAISFAGSLFYGVTGRWCAGLPFCRLLLLTKKSPSRHLKDKSLAYYSLESCHVPPLTHA